MSQVCQAAFIRACATYDRYWHTAAGGKALQITRCSQWPHWRSLVCLRAGLVGIGLCHLFAATGCEEASFASEMDELANHMGLFLQKTNIIRDYLEDIMEEPAPRMFWPREIWGQYTDKLADFTDPAYRCGASHPCKRLAAIGKIIAM